MEVQNRQNKFDWREKKMNVMNNSNQNVLMIFCV